MAPVGRGRIREGPNTMPKLLGLILLSSSSSAILAGQRQNIIFVRVTTEPEPFIFMLILLFLSFFKILTCAGGE